MPIDATVPGSGTTSDRGVFYDSMSQQHLAPLWESLHDLVKKYPKTPAVPVLWDYDNVGRPDG
jgi:gentisate 1,2-dioxygenase